MKIKKIIGSNHDENRVYLKFYKSIGTGHTVNCPEHFFHFIWGYFLPSLSFIMSNESSVRKNTTYCLRSCGPLMDPFYKEIFSLFDINYEIQKEKILDQSGLTKIIIPRWDMILVIRWYYFFDKFYRPRFKIWFKRFWDNISFSNRHYLFRTKKFKKQFIDEIAHTQNLIWNKISQFPANLDLDKYTDQYVILKRSEEPDYFKKGGGATEPGYGTARYSLKGIEEASKFLNEKGIPVKIFEPGICSLKDQINVFRKCKGIIFIKGTECTLMSWMKPGSKIIMIRPNINDKLPVQKNMSKVFNLEFHEVVTGPDWHPTLEPNLIYKYLAPH